MFKAGQLHSSIDSAWRARAVSEGIPEFMINFCDMHTLACRMSVQNDHPSQVYFVRLRLTGQSRGFYADVNSTPAELVEDFQHWAGLHG